MTEQEIEQSLIEKLGDLKYTYRPDIRDRATLDQNFRQHFEALNRVHLTDGEFHRLLEEIITPDVFDHAHVLRFAERATQVIVENYLNSIKLDDFLTGMAQPKLNRAKLDVIPIPLPDLSEQQKIAECLSSIEELITAQTHNLDALKAHKEGLMQQLFPAAPTQDSNGL